jgi:hypothetical protein
MNPKIADIDRPSGDNASYSLSFLGPVLQCEETNVTNITTYRQNDLDRYPEMNWLAIWSAINVLELSPMFESLSIKVVKDNYFEYSPCDQKSSDMNASASQETKFRDVKLLFPMRSLECSVFTTRYDANVSFANGVQSIIYSTAGKQPYSTPLELYPFPSSEFKPFQSMADYFQTAALVEAFLFQFQFQTMAVYALPTVPSSKKPEVKTIRLFNGSEITMEMCKEDLPDCAGACEYDSLCPFHQEISFHALMC